MRLKYIYFLFFVVLIFCTCGTSSPVVKNEQFIQVNDLSYEKDIRPIIENNCVTCHSGESPRGDFKLTTYEEVRFQTEKGKLLKRINDSRSPMPKSGLMPKKYRKAIKKWAENGFKKGSIQQTNSPMPEQTYSFDAPEIIPIDINVQGFEFFELMAGHWVGPMKIMGQDYEWFSFDYRPISPSHIHGIYEGGTMGNLMTSFFITQYNGKRTIMARNGGILNGIYRTSYFVLDKVELSDKRKYFRLIDAYGGKDIMWMDLEFIDDKLNFDSYTSRFGEKGYPKKHMEFKAQKRHPEIAFAVAKDFNYPQNVIDKDFSNGLPKPNWGDQFPVITSASYIYTAKDLDLITLGKNAGDPYPKDQIPHLASLKILIEQNDLIKDQSLLLYLSKDPLSNESGHLMLSYGSISQDIFDGVFSFPELVKNTEAYTFTYLHPGTYYLTLVADVSKTGYPSAGDVNNKSIKIEVRPNSSQEIKVKDIIIKN